LNYAIGADIVRFCTALWNFEADVALVLGFYSFDLNEALQFIVVCRKLTVVGRVLAFGELEFH
jgi:hypothetical protein